VQNAATFGEMLIAQRQQLGLSQSAAARKAGVDRMTWRAWEEGRSRPQDYNYVKIEYALELDPGGTQAMLTGDLPVVRSQVPARRTEADLRDETERAIWDTGKEGKLPEHRIWLRIDQLRAVRAKRAAAEKEGRGRDSA
jgi:transcriptional regulator with XRE-family HTH domain